MTCILWVKPQKLSSCYPFEVLNSPDIAAGCGLNPLRSIKAIEYCCRYLRAIIICRYDFGLKHTSHFTRFVRGCDKRLANSDVQYS